ncbi:MAG: carbamoyl-phosphate synthase large subunit, partial [Gammaproteobacteria bacterium]|nr:carbamoyl-phosphate synthase large subunit [Gammaproteobacteria bacterium]
MRIGFVGPSVRVLRLFGDKLKARDLAAANRLPVLPGSAVIDGAEQAEAFYEALQPTGAMILKAVAGGGGRGMRVIERKEDIAEALVRGAAEAQAAFGSDALYAERLIERALHIEVQVLGDRHGNVGHLGERDCSIQRRHQKIVEVAPSPQLHPSLRERILEAAVTLAQAADYDSIGTFEFLVDGADLSDASPFYFIEANPRIQVEHTVTEAVTDVDLVRVQLAIARGADLHDLGLA